MGAREKLNQTYINRSLFLAATLGIAARSILIFLVVLITMLAVGVHAGDVRTHSRRKRSRNRRSR